MKDFLEFMASVFKSLLIQMAIFCAFYGAAHILGSDDPSFWGFLPLLVIYALGFCFLTYAIIACIIEERRDRKSKHNTT
jgi:ABC-type polysaccharide/polyol phosphate export permease